MTASVFTASHLFITASGQPLPRWLEAFPRLRCVKPGAALGSVSKDGLVWLRPDPGCPAVDQIADLVVATGGAQILVLADQPDDEEALSLFSAGIRAYCNAHATAANLRQVAQVVKAGGLWIGPGLMARLLAATRRALPPESKGETRSGSPLASLTPRELEVAQEIARGASNKEVARSLGIAERTVKAHAGAIFEKLGARDRLQMALMVNGHGEHVGDPEATAEQPRQARLDAGPAALRLSRRA